eukprot:TRINITY_DN30360_c0_g1_i1.p1 TRINITY_DN30360_c0_g1~~TRINITY_DN30360_c0_g1_i1.p1  ORF type:complete len:386 (+),score=41.93 TRINITY_DN30360_c0_g1_i1:53-1159(+)
MDSAFSDLAPLLFVEAQWEILHESRVVPAGLISKRKVTGGSLLKFRYTLETPADTSLTVRAETYPAGQDKRNVWNTLEVIEPGECLVLRSSDAIGKVFLLLEVLLGDSSASWTNAEDSTPWHYCQRRDFPETDDATEVLCPTRCEVDSCIFFMCHRLTDSCQRRWMYHWAVFLPDFLQPVWAVENLVGLLEDDYFFTAQWHYSEEAKLWHQIDVSHYMLVSLKRCSSGPPLLPISSEREEADVVIDGVGWKLLETVIALSDYLRRLFQACGCNCRVFKSLDGWVLVPYQAVVLREEWEEYGPLIRSVWSRQEAAYRLAYATKSWPKLATDHRPRYFSNQLICESGETVARLGHQEKRFEIRCRSLQCP